MASRASAPLLGALRQGISSAFGKESGEIRMKCLSGREIELPLVSELGIVPCHVARRVTWHSHKGYQLLFLLRGETAYEFRQRGGERVDFPGGHFLVIPPGMVHRGVQDMRPPCGMVYLTLVSLSRESCRNTPFTAADWRWLKQRWRSTGFESRPFSRGLGAVLNELVRHVQSLSLRRLEPPDRIRLRALVCEVLLETVGCFERSTSSVPDDLVLAAERYFREHLGEELLISEAAKKLGLSRARLFELFRRGTGMTPNDFLLRARIERARELLATTGMNVTKIAFETGFGSSQYFSTVFRKYTGQTPVAFRQAHGRTG
jgi:AraC-like DNA-binding protein